MENILKERVKRRGKAQLDEEKMAAERFARTAQPKSSDKLSSLVESVKQKAAMHPAFKKQKRP